MYNGMAKISYTLMMEIYGKMSVQHNTLGQ